MSETNLNQELLGEIPSNALIGSYDDIQPYEEQHTQVYRATHEKGDRSSFMNRSFISFSFGGKYIEDFNFIVVSDGDRMNRNVYSNFTDNITESDVLDEQFFWSSHFNSNTLELTLATDGVTDRELDTFKYWFKPGVKRELILSEHPYRAIMAHVGAAPTYSFLPFEKKTTCNVGGLTYNTSTTVYKGEVQLQFTMEDPYWYSVSNILYYRDEDNDEIDYDKWLSAKGIPIVSYRDPDAIKVILEDGIITNAMLKSDDVLFGSDVCIDQERNTKTKIGEDSDADIDPAMHASLQSADVAGAEGEDPDYENRGRIGPLLKENEGLTLEQDQGAYFYYGGSAPSKPILTFEIAPVIENDFIVAPLNTFVEDATTPYNTIWFACESVKQFSFTTPSIWTGYNQAIAILKAFMGKSAAKADVRRALMEGINHYAPRAYALKVTFPATSEETSENNEQSEDEPVSNSENTVNVNVEDTTLETAISAMANFLCDNENNPYTAKFTFNNKTGESKGIFTYHDADGNEKIIEEDVGDMVKSNYLIIEDRNYPSADGYIQGPDLSGSTIVPRDQYHTISHDYPTPIQHFLLIYKFMYY